MSWKTTKGKVKGKIIMFKKVWKADDLKGEKPIDDAYGYWNNYRGCFDLNYSSILTKLIQEAGRWCEHYASDLFISWKTVEKELENAGLEDTCYYFGFRKMGVDHLPFILNRLNNGESTEIYRAIWKLEVIMGGTEDDRKCTMALSKVTI